MIIGVSGKYCSGKNTVTETLIALGFSAVDVDLVGHAVLEEKKEELSVRFGNGILHGNGGINRRALGRIVFKSPKKLAALEAIVHPLMVQKVEQFLKNRENVIINAAVLYKMKLHLLCDAVMYVTAPVAVRFRRAVRRDGLPFFQIVKRFWSQRSLNAKPLKKEVDTYIIKNTTQAGLQKKLKCILDRIKGSR